MSSQTCPVCYEYKTIDDFLPNNTATEPNLICNTCYSRALSPRHPLNSIPSKLTSSIKSFYNLTQPSLQTFDQVTFINFIQSRSTGSLTLQDTPWV